MPKAESEFLYRPVSSVVTPGFVIDRVGEDRVTPLQTPFKDGFVPDFSRLVTSYRKPHERSQLIQVSPTHKRAFEMRYGPTEFIFWSDEYENMYGAHQLKGGNVAHPDVRVERRAPSGFVIWGLQDSDSVLRTIRASEIMRKNHIPTEAIVRLVEPSELIFKGETVSTPEFKRKLIEKVWKDNHRDLTKNEDGWSAVTRSDVPKLTKELSNMTIYLSTLGRQVSERFLDLSFTSSPDDLQKVMSRVFTFWNTRNHWFEKKQLQPLSEDLDSKSTDDIVQFFTIYLPKEVAKNYATLHNLGLVHTYPHLGNVSLVGSIYDVDSVYGEALGIGDEPVTTKEILDDLTCLMKGREGFQHADGIIHLLHRMRDRGILPQEGVAKKFSQTFAIEYIKSRGWAENTIDNLDNIQQVMHLSNIYFFADEDSKSMLRDALGKDNFDTLTKYFLLKSYGDSSLYGKIPIIVDIENMPSTRPEVSSDVKLAELKEERKAEIIHSASEALIAHSAHLSHYPSNGKFYFSFPKVSDAILEMHAQMKEEDVIDLVRMWNENEMKALTGKFEPRAVGSFMLALGQLNIGDLTTACKVATPDKDDPLFLKKLSGINEFVQLLPGYHKYGEELFDLFGSWVDVHDVEYETEFKSGIALFGRGIITRRLHEMFNHFMKNIILNEFTYQQLEALEEALDCPDLVDPLMGRDNTTTLLRTGITGIQVRHGETNNLALLQGEKAASRQQVNSADLQYLFASADKDNLVDSKAAEAMEIKIDSAWCREVLRELIISKKPLHPNSFFAQTLKEVDLKADDLTDILKTALDLNDGNLEELDPTVKDILESKNYKGVVSKKKAAELVWSLVGFGIEFPKILEASLGQSRNKKAFMDFLSENRVSKDTGVYRNDHRYPTSPVYEIMSKGVEVLPLKIKELFAENGARQPDINSLAINLVNHLFDDGYLRFFFGGMMNLENYPPAPFGLRDLMVRHTDRKNEFQIWRTVHPDIWDILRLATPNVLKTTINSHLDDQGKVTTEFRGKGMSGIGHHDVSECLPPDLYQKISSPNQSN